MGNRRGWLVSGISRCQKEAKGGRGWICFFCFFWFLGGWFLVVSLSFVFAFFGLCLSVMFVVVLLWFFDIGGSLGWRFLCFIVALGFIACLMILFFI